MTSHLHAELLAYLNKLNTSFLSIIETVCCFRIELGTSLEKMVECHNSIYLQQFEIFYGNKIEKEIELQKKIDEHTLKIAELQAFLQETEEERQVRLNLV